MRDLSWSRSATNARFTSGMIIWSFGFAARNGRQRFMVIEMVRVVVARSDDVNEVEFLRRDDPFRHAHMRLVCRGVFLSQGVRKVRINQQASVARVDQKPALTEPPEMNRISALSRGMNIGQKGFVL